MGFAPAAARRSVSLRRPSQARHSTHARCRPHGGRRPQGPARVPPVRTSGRPGGPIPANPYRQIPACVVASSSVASSTSVLIKGNAPPHWKGGPVGAPRRRQARSGVARAEHCHHSRRTSLSSALHSFHAHPLSLPDELRHRVFCMGTSFRFVTDTSLFAAVGLFHEHPLPCPGGYCGPGSSHGHLLSSGNRSPRPQAVVHFMSTSFRFTMIPTPGFSHGHLLVVSVGYRRSRRHPPTCGQHGKTGKSMGVIVNHQVSKTECLFQRNLRAGVKL